jgi:polysaccharide pyruvyl transferase WcaK-like protein
MKSRTAMLLGAYGQTNLGDDLLLYNYVRLLRKMGFDKIYVNSSLIELIPPAIIANQGGLEVFETYNSSLVQLVKLMTQSDCIVYGGGTVYKELYATTGRSRYSVISRVMVFNCLARLLGKQIYNLHIGIGSIKTKRGRLITRLALRVCTQTIFRDKESYDYAKQTLRLPEAITSHSTDGLFIDKSWQKPWRSLKLQNPRGSCKIVGVNVLSDIPDWIPRERYIQQMAEFVDEIIERGDYVVFLPFQTDFNPHNDLTFMKDEFIPAMQQKQGFEILDQLSLDTIISTLQQIDVLVGMRFHSLLLATVANTPFIAVAYDTKCWRYVQENNYPYAIKLEDVSSANLLSLYQQLLSDNQEVKRNLQVIADKHFTQAKALLEELHI